MAYFWQIISNGLHNGMLYALLAYSYVLLHQVVPKPNLAHGAFFALSGQIMVMAVNFAYNALIFTLAASIGFAFSAASALALIALFFFAVTVVPRFAGRSANMMIVVTLALSIVMMEAVRIGSDGRDFWLPPLTTVSVPLGAGASITQVQLANIVAIAVILLLAELVLHRTTAGRAIRAVAQSPIMSALCGVNVRFVLIGTAFAASAMALAGGFLAILHFGNMSFGAGLSYGLKVLFIAAAGGFSTPRMAALAAFVFGEAEAMWDGYLPIIWREAFFFAALALMLILRGREIRE
jgi:branched-chain amino acid transport system permease protein